jgi:hypothetical protein
MTKKRLKKSNTLTESFLLRLKKKKISKGSKRENLTKFSINNKSGNFLKYKEEITKYYIAQPVLSRRSPIIPSSVEISPAIFTTLYCRIGLPFLSSPTNTT